MNRQAQIDQLKKKHFDVLVIGGGATGAGVALDAACRGLSVALVEARDFSSETSSRSTKLIHGGVRYLEQAFTQLDWGQYELVRDALHERSVLLSLAPHLCKPLPLLTPLYKLLDIPYFTSGLKIYDKIAGPRSLGPSRFVGAREALRLAPMLRSNKLRGGVIYYDGQFNDARMNLAIAMTAAEQGAVLSNYVSVESLEKQDGKLVGAAVVDHLGGQRWTIKAKAIVNATGPFSDQIRKMDDPETVALVSTSSGSHLIVDAKHCPSEMGVLIPRTEDERVLFLLPWENHTLVGTTDNASTLQENPKAGKQDIEYILKHINKYFSSKLGESDVRCHWAGLRPLVSSPGLSKTAALSRDHLIEESESGLITIVGGKWTTYRLMAKETIERVVKSHQLKAVQKDTKDVKLIGADEYTVNQWQTYETKFGIDATTAQHLSNSYGSRGHHIGEKYAGSLKPLVPGLFYTEAEVLYAVEQELACRLTDVLGRRLRLGFLNQQATIGAVERVGQLMADCLGWNEETRLKEQQHAKDYFAIAN